MQTNSTTSDLAADSPLSYEQLHAAKQAGTLGQTLAALTPAQRVAAAAVVAERRGRSVSHVLEVFAKVMGEAASPELPTVRKTAGGAFLVRSRTRALVHVVSSDGRQCSCEAAQHGRHCHHLDKVASFRAAPLAFPARFTLSRAA